MDAMQITLGKKKQQISDNPEHVITLADSTLRDISGWQGESQLQEPAFHFVNYRLSISQSTDFSFRNVQMFHFVPFRSPKYYKP